MSPRLHGRHGELASSDELGTVYAAELVFHNAYGPDKPWFYDPALSGGGCVMDLGGVSAQLFAGGAPLADRPGQVEDYTVAQLTLESGGSIRIACSWKLQAGREADISAAFYGTAGGAALRNVDGSFYDFIADRHRGTERERLSSPPEAWGGRAAADWAVRLAGGQRFDPAAERLVEVSSVLDRIYGRGA